MILGLGATIGSPGAWRDTVCGGLGDDLISGGPGSDGIRGGRGNDTVDAGAGLDWLFADGDDDRLDGGTGLGLIDFRKPPEPITSDLGAGTALGYDRSGTPGLGDDDKHSDDAHLQLLP